MGRLRITVFPSNWRFVAFVGFFAVFLLTFGETASYGATKKKSTVSNVKENATEPESQTPASPTSPLQISKPELIQPDKNWVWQTYRLYYCDDVGRLMSLVTGSAPQVLVNGVNAADLNLATAQLLSDLGNGSLKEPPLQTSSPTTPVAPEKSPPSTTDSSKLHGNESDAASQKLKDNKPSTDSSKASETAAIPAAEIQENTALRAFIKATVSTGHLPISELKQPYYAYIPQEITDSDSDPVKNVRIYGFPQERLIAIHGTRNNVLRVTDALSKFDTPQAQTVTTLWTFQMSIDDNRNRDAGKSLQVIDQELSIAREQVSTVLNFFKECVIQEVSSVASETNELRKYSFKAWMKTLDLMFQKEFSTQNEPGVVEKARKEIGLKYQPSRDAAQIQTFYDWEALDQIFPAKMNIHTQEAVTDTMFSSILRPKTCFDNYLQSLNFPVGSAATSFPAVVASAEKMAKDLTYQEELISALIPSPEAITTFGEALVVLSLAKIEHRKKVSERFFVEVSSRLASCTQQVHASIFPKQRISDFNHCTFPGLRQFFAYDPSKISGEVLDTLKHEIVVALKLRSAEKMYSYVAGRYGKRTSQIPAEAASFDNVYLQVSDDAGGPAIVQRLLNDSNPILLMMIRGCSDAEARAREAAANEALKRVMKAFDEDLQLHFIEPMFNRLRNRLKKETHSTVNSIQRTSILGLNRGTAKVDTSANAVMPPEETTDALSDFNKLLTFYGDVTTGSGLTTVAQSLVNLSKVASDLKDGNATGTSDTSKSNIATGIYGLTSGSIFQITPIVDPSGQALRFRFDHDLATRLRAPDGTVDNLSRIDHHRINTEVQLSNHEIRTISQFDANSRVGRPETRSGGIPILRDLRGLRNLPLIGWFSRTAQRHAVLQESLVLAQANIYPTISDITNLLTKGLPVAEIPTVAVEKQEAREIAKNVASLTNDLQVALEKTSTQEDSLRSIEIEKLQTLSDAFHQLGSAAQKIPDLPRASTNNAIKRGQDALGDLKENNIDEQSISTLKQAIRELTPIEKVTEGKSPVALNLK